MAGTAAPSPLGIRCAILCASVRVRRARIPQVWAACARVRRNPLRIGPAATRKILLLGLGVDSACSRPARCRCPSGVQV